MVAKKGSLIRSSARGSKTWVARIACAMTLTPNLIEQPFDRGWQWTKSVDQFAAHEFNFVDAFDVANAAIELQAQRHLGDPIDREVGWQRQVDNETLTRGCGRSSGIASGCGALLIFDRLLQHFRI